MSPMSPEQERKELIHTIVILHEQNERLRAKIERLQESQRHFFDAGWHAGRRTNRDAAGSWKHYLESIGRA
jgi:hypothetical protein